MEKKERLELYKQALKDFENGATDTDRGFCYYFYNHDVDVYSIYGFKVILPELYTQKPDTPSSLSHWWKTGNREPRIKALKKAIKLCGG